MPERTVVLSATEAMLVRLAVERRNRETAAADAGFNEATAPLLATHGKKPEERADIRDGTEPGSLVIVFSQSE